MIQDANRNVCARFYRFPLSTCGIDGGKRVTGGLSEYLPREPLISYITVVRNGEATLMRCMESIWNQDYQNIEYIIIDGGSTDQTLEMLHRYAHKIDYFISEPDLGVYSAMNKGISLARGELICFLNCDDEATAHAARIASECFQATGARLIAGRRYLRLVGGKIIEEDAYPRFIYSNAVFRHNRFWHQSLYAHRDAFKLVGDLPERFPIVGDFVWTRRCVDAKLSVCLIEDILSCYFWGGVSSVMTDQLNEEMACQIHETFPNMTAKDAKRIYLWLEVGAFWERVRFWKLLYMIARYGFNNKFRRSFWLGVLSAEADELCYLIRKQGALPQAVIRNLPMLQGRTLSENFDGLCKTIQHECENQRCPGLGDIVFLLRLKRELDIRYQKAEGEMRKTC